MTISPAERQARAGLPMIRFMQTYLPLSTSRWLLRQGMARLRLDDDVTREAVSAGGVPCEWIIPPGNLNGQVLVYLHGGGFVLGVSPLHVRMAAYMARQLGMRVLMVDYRLGPEDPYPAALDDCVTAYRWLLDQDVPAGDIALAGDSAGGNLALTALLKLRDSGDPLPAAAACLSPVTDLTERDYPPRAPNDPILPRKVMRFYAEAYVGDSDAHDPLISPVYGDLRGLPPLLVHAGEDEVLCTDAVRITDRAKSMGVAARLEIYPRMWHVWQLNLEMPQAVQSLGDMTHFLKTHVGSDPL